MPTVFDSPLATPADWDRFYREEVPLDDVLGVPGLDQLDVEQTPLSELPLRQIVAQEGLFLCAEMEIRTPATTLLRELVGPTFLKGMSAPGTSSFEIESVVNSACGQHVRVQQLLDGLPVVGAQFQIHADARVAAITGRPTLTLGQLSGPIRPLDERMIGNVLLELFGDGVRGPKRLRNVLFPIGDDLVQAVETAFIHDDPFADVVVYLGADGLNLLLSYNIASVLSGRGLVHDVNPLRTPALVDVELEDIGPIPNDQLHGPASCVVPDRPPAVCKSDRDFRLQPQEAGFDEVQTFHHLAQVRRYFEGLVTGALLGQPPFTPINAIVRDRTMPGQAGWSPTNAELRFGDFPGGRPSARSADIVYHEFTHAVSDSICQLGRGATRDSQARGLAEGFSDYFACSALDDPRFGDYVQDDPNGARNCSIPGRFNPGFIGREHDNGQVWASVLWAIRVAVGQTVADKIALESLYYLSWQSTFDEGEAALLTVDRQLDPVGSLESRHEQIIKDAYSGAAP